MPFDGLVINSVVTELKNSLVNSRIDKIYQPESDEIIIKFRNTKENRRLLISVNSSFPYFCLSNIHKVNPMNPPIFCMVLRKHLQGGKIVDIKQVDFDRIIAISIECFDELGNLNIKNLFIEIMGKHSNIILVNDNSNTIIDSIKRVPINVSRLRQVLPGLNYNFPPTNKKMNLFHVNFEEFLNSIYNYRNKNEAAYKFLFKTFQGISPVLAKDICIKSSIDYEKSVQNLNHMDFHSIWNTVMNLKTIVMGKNFSPNIIINSKNKKIVDFSSIDLSLYNKENFFTIVYKHSISEIIEKFYYSKDKNERIKQKSYNIKKVISSKLEKLHNKLQKQKEELIRAKDADKYRVFGELILSNIHKITKGMNKFETVNYYEHDMPTITIPLDIKLTPSENSQKYFKLYNKFKTAYAIINEQIENTKMEINYLENVLTCIENTDDLDNLEEIRLELIEQGYFKKKRFKTKKEKKPTFSEPYKYFSSDGFLILAGKNNKQNDIITLKTARKNDIWLHTKNLPGSHVIIKTEGKQVPEKTIIEAAKIAAYNSKGRYSSNVPVDYTSVKYVKKPSGAKPGMVIYENYKTIYVTPDEEEIEALQTQST